jgi:hypothetical protein
MGCLRLPSSFSSSFFYFCGLVPSYTHHHAKVFWSMSSTAGTRWETRVDTQGGGLLWIFLKTLP